jgi:competence protein ComEC
MASCVIVVWMHAGVFGAHHRCRAHSIPRHATGGSLRNNLIGSLDDDRLLPEGRALVAALVLGDRSEIDPAVRESYRYLGIAHVLALSGLHLGIVAIAALRLTAPLPLPRWLRDCLVLALLAAYGSVAAFPPSLKRALALAAALVFGRVFCLRLDILRALIAGSVALVLVDASIAFSTAFQLSFTAVLAIAVVAVPTIKRLERSLPRGPAGMIPRLLCFSLVTTLSIQVISLPIVLTRFDRVPVLAPIANIVFTPLVAACVYLGIAYLVLQQPVARTVLSAALNPIARGLWYAPLKVSNRPMPGILAPDIEPRLFTAGAVLIIASVRARGRWRVFAIAGAAVCIIASAALSPGASIDPMLRTAAHGAQRYNGSRSGAACADLYGGSNGVLIVDGWLPRSRAARIVRALWRSGIDNVHTLMITRGSPGNTAGIVHLLERIGFEEIICSPYLTHGDDRFTGTARRLGVSVRADPGQFGYDTGAFCFIVRIPGFPPPEGVPYTTGDASLDIRVSRPRGR